MMRRLRLVLGILLTWTISAGIAASEIRLVMFEEQGCSWCEIWKEEIGGIYPLTVEGKSAPLMVLDISDPIPGEISLDRLPNFTPTFVLMKDGKEHSRIEGYPGEDFFWGLLEKMLKDMKAGKIQS